MKKLLLLLFLFLSISLNAQPPGITPPLTVCDNNNDGIAVFDLTPIIPQILSGLNPATTDVTFHETQADAESASNAIQNPNNYININPFNQFLYIRIWDNPNGEVYYSTVNLIVTVFANAGTDGTVTVCETSSTPFDLFTLITGEQAGGIWVRTSGTGGTFNPSAGTFIPSGGATTSTFDYTVASQACNNSDSSVASIVVNPQPNAGTDGTLTVCDTNTTAIDLFNLIAGEQAGGIWTRTGGTGGTFNAATGTYTPAAGATTSSFTYTISAAAPCINDSSVATININCAACEALTPTTLVSFAVTTTNVTISWTQPVVNNPANNWEILVLPSGSPAPTTATSGMFSASFNTSYVITGLTASTTYDIYVRSLCSISNVSDWSGALTVSTNTNPPVCGGNFVDDGGINGNYSNNANSTTTICPVTAGDLVTVTFTSFNTEVGWDALYVYDGFAAIPAQQIPSTNPTANIPGGMAGGYWGNTIPGPFTSSSQSGCLTFVFRSDPSNNLPGWVANVSCSPSPQCDAPSALTAANATNTSAVIHWTSPSNFTSFEVLILPEGSPAPTFNSFGTSVQGNTLVAANLLPDVCYSAYVRTICAWSSEWSAPVDFCMVSCENNGNCAENLVLISFVDVNNNGVKDSGEINFNYGNFVYQVNDSTDNQYGTSSNGIYHIFDSNPANSYDIRFDVATDLNAYYSSSVTHDNITLPTGSGSHTLYFPIINTQPYVDAQISIIPGGQPRPGFTYGNFVYYQNRGMQTIPSGTITFTKSSNVTIATLPPGATPAFDGFTYNFTNLATSETRAIYVGFLVPTIPMVALGDLVTNTASIQISNDADVSNNTATLSQTIVGSYDPNDKSESHGGKIVHDNFTANDYLYYTIQFENTGTANAEFIRIEDALDNQLDQNTFEMISSSHTVDTKREVNQLTWHFYDIDLPPTVTSPTQSHGFVTFRIKPKSGYEIGDVIPNTAFIYFDYNPAIVTNTYDTEFVETLGNDSFDAYSISIAPNPASRLITITNNNTLEKIAMVNIYDLTGKKIYTLNNNSLTNISIDVSPFAKGLYLIELLSDNNSKVAKKLILK